MLQFLTSMQYTEFGKLMPMLKSVMLLADDYCKRKYGIDLIVTCVFRENEGVHGLWRGGDGDNHKLTYAQKQDIADYINWSFEYDRTSPEKLVCLHHPNRPERKLEDGSLATHLHFQVHPNTRQIWRAI